MHGIVYSHLIITAFTIITQNVSVLKFQSSNIQLRCWKINSGTESTPSGEINILTH